jgi:hypothetical protein
MYIYIYVYIYVYYQHHSDEANGVCEEEAAEGYYILGGDKDQNEERPRVVHEELSFIAGDDFSFM